MSIITVGTSVPTGFSIESNQNGNLVIKTGPSATTAATFDSGGTAVISKLSVTTFTATSLTLTTPVPVGSGGTGLTSAGTTGNILVSNGTSWTSQAPAPGGAQDYIVQSYGIV